MNTDLDAGTQLLSAWLSLTSTLWNTRMVTEMTFNEAHVLGLLLSARDADAAAMTATDLIARTHMLKSQMNKLLTGLEAHGYITRTRSEADKRMVLIELTAEGESAYLSAHAHVDEVLLKLVAQIGQTRALTVANDIQDIVSVLDGILGKK